MLGMRSGFILICLHDSFDKFSFTKDGFKLPLLLSSLSILLWLLLVLSLLLLLLLEVLLTDFVFWPTPMAARHEVRHEYLLVEIIGEVGGLAEEANEACVDDFLSLCNLNIFKLNEYFESRACTFILKMCRMCNL